MTGMGIERAMSAPYQTAQFNKSDILALTRYNDDIPCDGYEGETGFMAFLDRPG